MDSLKPIFVKALSTAVVSWLIFMSIDFMMLAAFTIAQESHYSLFPGFFSVLALLTCYLSIGILLGLITAIALCIKTALAQGKPSDGFHASLSLSLTANCLINLYSIGRALSMPFQTTVLFILLGGFLFWGLITFTRFLKKSAVVSLLALCVSLELFWGTVRGCLRGGIFLLTAHGITVVYAFLLALLVCATIFTLLYSVAPALVLKMKKLPLMVALFSCGTCLLCSGSLNTCSTHESIPPCISKPNILLIVMDTTRVDHLSCYNYPKKTTPHIDAFAAEALTYTNAYATASWTLPSIASLLTGTYPGYHGAHRIETTETYLPMNALDDTKTTLAELLKQAGYSTAGMVSCEFLTERFGLHQGFTHFDDTISSYLFTLSTFGAVQFLNHFFPVVDYLSSKGLYGYSVAEQVNKSALSWLEENGRGNPFFLFLHYFDPHHPYLPEHLGTDSKNIPDGIGARYRKDYVNYIDMERDLIDSVRWGKKPLLPDERHYLINNYDREIGELDKKIGDIFKKLRELDLYDTTLIIVTADHGESFGEHNLMLHGVHLYEDTIHVPLLIKYPLCDQQKGFIDYPVSLTGVVPTICSYLSISTPDFIQGAPFNQPHHQKIIAQNFFDRNLKGQKWANSLTHDLISLHMGDYKYIDVSDGEDQLFNLKEDPQETNNIIHRDSQTGSTMRNLLATYTEQLKLTEKAAGTVVLDEKTLQNLKALGYLN
jgi:arylsulfatase A-like enzyme